MADARVLQTSFFAQKPIASKGDSSDWYEICKNQEVAMGVLFTHTHWSTIKKKSFYNWNTKSIYVLLMM